MFLFLLITVSQKNKSDALAFWHPKEAARQAFSVEGNLIQFNFLILAQDEICRTFLSVHVFAHVGLRYPYTDMSVALLADCVSNGFV